MLQRSSVEKSECAGVNPPLDSLALQVDLPKFATRDSTSLPHSLNDFSDSLHEHSTPSTSLQAYNPPARSTALIEHLAARRLAMGQQGEAARTRH